MGYELYIKLKDPLYLSGVHLSELEFELEESRKEMERIRMEVALLVGSGFKRKSVDDEGERLYLEDDTSEYVRRIGGMFEEYEDLVRKIFLIKLAMENRDSVEESY
jgi:hypothetical protein